MSKQRFCSHECQYHARLEIGKIQRLETFNTRHLVPCSICGQPFRAKKPTQQKFCSKACYHKNLKIYQQSYYQSKKLVILDSHKEKSLKLRSNLQCVQCGETFTGRRGDQKHCSSSCRIKYAHVCRIQHFTAKNEEKVCVVCKKLFVKKSEDQKLCSLACRNAYSKFVNINPPLFKPVLSNCSICGQAYTKKSKNGLFCGVSCKRAAEKSRRLTNPSLCKYCEKPSDRGIASVVCTSCLQEETYKPQNLQCVTCNTPLVARTTKRRFCDNCLEKRKYEASKLSKKTSPYSVGSKKHKEHLALKSLSNMANMLSAVKNLNNLHPKLEEEK
jgi:hypothetical protein